VVPKKVYEKNGKFLPGKKGISLNVDQYVILKKLISTGAIDKEVKAIDE